jgi:hypothetical protein
MLSTFHHNFIIDMSNTNLMDEVNVMVLNSKSILEVIWVLHIEMGINQINSQQIHCALNSVIRELDNINAVIESHHDSLKSTQNK